MKMKLFEKIIGISFILLLLSTEVLGQDNDDNKRDQFKPYLFSGGSLWMGFGSYTYVDVNLVLGSQITERINLGLSGKYQYLNDKRSVSGNFETSVYGGSIFSQISIIKDFRNIIKVKSHSGIIAHLEYEFLNTKYNYIYFSDTDTDKSRYWLHNVLIGGGYFQQMSQKAKSYIIILWNLNPNNKNPYTYPQLRVGFSIAI